MTLLEGGLGEPGVIARPLVKAQDGVVTGIAAQDGFEPAIGLPHRKHRHGVIHRPL